MVEESIHVKFNDKELDYHMLELVESFADIQVSEDHLVDGPSKIRSLEDDGSDAGLPKADPISEAHLEARDSEETPDGSEVSTQPKKPFKYKVSHPEELIIGNIDNPLNTISAFRDDNYMLGFISLIEPTSVDKALSNDGWIIAMQE